MIVKILGIGCSKCKALEQRIIALKEKHELDIQIEKVNQLIGHHTLWCDDDTRTGRQRHHQGRRQTAQRG